MAVAFDAATTVEEASGDGVVSVSHTNVGTTDIAAFAGSTNSESPAGLGTTTVLYDLTAMTEMWDIQQGLTGCAGYQLALGDLSAAARTVTATLAGIAPGYQVLSVVTMTGVDQTTPVGTAGTDQGTDGATSITISDAADDDLIIDCLHVHNAPTIGADQTQRTANDDSSRNHRTSTQPGTANDIMTWTFTSAVHTYGAVAFKAVSGGAAQEKSRWGIGFGIGGATGTNLSPGIIG